MTVSRYCLLALTCLPLVVLGIACSTEDGLTEPADARIGSDRGGEPEARPSHEPQTAADSAPSGAALVEALRNDPVALDIIRGDTELIRRFNRKPTIPQVLSELRRDPGLVLFRIRKTLSDPWVFFGFGAQGLFFMRFLVQWIASERRKRSHIPVAFWYFSLAGGITLFTYAVRQLDPVFMIGQGLGCFIYVRNLILIHRRPRAVGFTPRGGTG